MSSAAVPSELDLAVVRYRGENGAAQALAEARDGAGADATWVNQVGLVEHHGSGLALRGVFAGHFVDADERDHLSERGAAEGFAVGAVVGVLGGPPGFAAGMVLGAILGSQLASPTETEPEPEALAEALRQAVPRASSAIVSIGSPRDVEELLEALADSGGEVTRRKLTDEQVAELQASLASGA